MLSGKGMIPIVTRGILSRQQLGSENWHAAYFAASAGWSRPVQRGQNDAARAFSEMPFNLPAASVAFAWRAAAKFCGLDDRLLSQSTGLPICRR
jgi:hypothetical protein